MTECNEAVVVLCKCGEHHKTYGIRMEKRGRDDWVCTWAFPIKEDAAKREGYDNSFVQGNISFTEEYPGCPYCGRDGWTVCSCGHLSCTIVEDGSFTCEWCGDQGPIGDYTGEAIAASIDF